jgi:hypothetical protein
MGEPVTSGSGPYTHTFDPLPITYPVPLTVWGVNNDLLKNDAGTSVGPIVSKFIGAVGNTLTISCEVNNYVRFDGSLVSKAADVDDGSAPSITTDTSKKWVFNQILVEMKVGAGSYAETYANSFSFEMNNNLITDLGRLGSNELMDIPLGDLDGTLTVGFLRNIPDHYRRMFMASPTQVALKITATGSLIAGSDYFTFSLEFPYLETTPAELARNGGETLRSFDVPFNVVTDPTSGKMVTPVIKNSTSGALYGP